MTLVVLKYSYEGVVTESGSGDESLVGCICNRANEVVYGLVDFFGREVGGWGTGEGIELIELEGALFLVAPPGKELMRARNLEGALGTRSPCTSQKLRHVNTRKPRRAVTETV